MAVGGTGARAPRAAPGEAAGAANPRGGGATRYLVLGGGCYGTFYARQLLRARDAGSLGPLRVLVVDRNQQPGARRELPPDPDLHFVASEWDDFLDAHLSRLPPEATDQVVPSPFTPHLALAWLLRRLREERPERAWALEPFRRLPGTPFQLQREGGPLLVSHADWVCPVHCIEPDTCPHTGGPRSWDVDRTARALAGALEAEGQAVGEVRLLHCHHRAWGVGTYPARELLEARDAILDGLREGKPARILVGTISRCHGALNLLVATA